MIVLERIIRDDSTVCFRLIAPKRGTRIAPDFCKYLEWAKDGGIYWREIPPPVISDNSAEEKEKKRETEILNLAQKAAACLQPGEAIGKTDFRRRFVGILKITSKNKIESIFNFCIGQKLVIVRDARKEDNVKKNVKEVVTLPRSEKEESQDLPLF